MEIAKLVIPAPTLALCVAETQGSMGFAIQQVLGNLLRRRGLPDRVAAPVCPVGVDPADPAFAPPRPPPARPPGRPVRGGPGPPRLRPPDQADRQLLPAGAGRAARAGERLAGRR